MRLLPRWRGNCAACNWSAMVVVQGLFWQGWGLYQEINAKSPCELKVRKPVCLANLRLVVSSTAWWKKGMNRFLLLKTRRKPVYCFCFYCRVEWWFRFFVLACCWSSKNWWLQLDYHYGLSSTDLNLHLSLFWRWCARRHFWEGLIGLEDGLFLSVKFAVLLDCFMMDSVL